MNEYKYPNLLQMGVGSLNFSGCTTFAWEVRSETEGQGIKG